MANLERVDPRLVSVIAEAAKRFPDYEVTYKSGYREGDKRQHGRGKAIDVTLVDRRTGKALPDYQNAQTFRTYEKFAQTVRAVQQEMYPGLSKSLRWGGYFSGPKGKYGAVDLMHFDLAGHIGMGGGSWEKGLTNRQRSLFPGVQSFGMKVADFLGFGDSPPLPTFRPSPARPDNLAASGPLGKFTVPGDSFHAAPLGRVDRAPLRALPSPSRPDNASAAGPRGNFSVPPARLQPAPVGRVDRMPLPPVGRPNINPMTAVNAGSKAASSVANIPRPSPMVSPAAKAVSSVSSVANLPRPMTPPAAQAVSALSSIANLPKAPPPNGLGAALSAIKSVSTVPTLQPPAPAMAPPLPAPRVIGPPPPIFNLPVALPPPNPLQMAVDAAPYRAPAVPSLTPADIYGGAVGSARASGENTVAGDGYGNTSVQNKYGATTITDKYGNQSAGSLISGPLGGSSILGSEMFEDTGNGRSKFGQKARGLGGSLAGSALGGLLGPAGSIIGALLGRELAKPGGGRIGDFMNGVRTIDTSRMPASMGLGATTQFAKAQKGGAFPAAPTMAGALGGKDTNRSYAEMRDISPKAARDISRGLGGLF